MTTSSATRRADAKEAADLVRAHRLPYLVVESALGGMPEPVALALVETLELDELLSRLVLLARRGLVKGRVRRAERAEPVELPRGASAEKIGSALSVPWSDLGLGTSAGAALALVSDEVERLVIVSDGTENRAPRLAGALLERRARVDPAVVLVQPHDGARQLAVDLEAAAIAAEVFTIDRWGLGHRALVGVRAGQRGVDRVARSAPAAGAEGPAKRGRAKCDRPRGTVA
jgi:hypothetical protein